MISQQHQRIYVQKGISKYFFVLYIRTRLNERVRIAAVAYARVRANITESPSPNHAVSENGIYILRNTRANRTEKVTVPISWYLPSRNAGSFLLRIISLSVLVGANLEIFAPNTKIPPPPARVTRASANEIRHSPHKFFQLPGPR